MSEEERVKELIVSYLQSLGYVNVDGFVVEGSINLTFIAPTPVEPMKITVEYE